MRAIVNADDFGKNLWVTNAIADSFKEGLITQTTLMVNMPDVDRAVQLAKDNGFADKVGLHINLTEGQPLTDAMKTCDVFCDDAGNFASKRPSSRWLPLKTSVAKVLHDEIEAQIRRYLDYKLPLLHCDGHHHMQTWIPIALELAPLLRQYRFKTIRKPYTIAFRSTHPMIRSRLRYCAWATIIMFNGIGMCDAFGGWDNYLEYANNQKKDALLELMVHPIRNRSDGTLIDITDFHNLTGRSLEAIAKRLREDGVRMCSYAELV